MRINLIRIQIFSSSQIYFFLNIFFFFFLSENKPEDKNRKWSCCRIALISKIFFWSACWCFPKKLANFSYVVKKMFLQKYAKSPSQKYSFDYKITENDIKWWTKRQKTIYNFTWENKKLQTHKKYCSFYSSLLFLSNFIKIFIICMKRLITSWYKFKAAKIYSFGL